MSTFRHPIMVASNHLELLNYKKGVPVLNDFHLPRGVIGPLTTTDSLIVDL
jgi:hypothetical protein